MCFEGRKGWIVGSVNVKGLPGFGTGEAIEEGKLRWVVAGQPLPFGRWGKGKMEVGGGGEEEDMG